MADHTAQASRRRGQVNSGKPSLLFLPQFPLEEDLGYHSNLAHRLIMIQYQLRDRSDQGYHLAQSILPVCRRMPDMEIEIVTPSEFPRFLVLLGADHRRSKSTRQSEVMQADGEAQASRTAEVCTLLIS